MACLSTMAQFSFPFYFSVHKTFVFVVTVHWPSVAVGFVHTIDLKGSLKWHGKAVESWAPG